MVCFDALCWIRRVTVSRIELPHLMRIQVRSLALLSVASPEGVGATVFSSIREDLMVVAPLLHSLIPNIASIALAEAPKLPLLIRHSV